MTPLFRLLAGATVAAALIVPPGVAAAAWGPDETVVRGRVVDVDLAANDRGQAIVAWRDDRAAAVRARFRRSDGRLGPVRTLSRRGREAGFPSVAIDPRGDALVAWMESLGGRRRTIWAAVMRRGGRWLSRDLVGRTAKSFPQPRAAMAPDKDAVVVWRYGTNLQVAFRRWGHGFGAPRPVGPSGAHHVVRYDRGSRAWLAYAPYPRPGAALVATSPPGARRFGRPARAGNPPASFVALADSSTGEIGLAYRRSPVPDSEDHPGPIEVAIRRPGGGWSEAQAVSPAGYLVPGQPPSTLADRPAIAAAWDGSMVVTWLQTVTSGGIPVDGREEIAAAVRDPGQPGFGPAFVLGTGGQFTYPSIATDDARRTAVVWRGTPDARIVAAVRRPGGVFGVPEPLSAPGAWFWPRVAGGPAPMAAVLEPGRAVLRAWR